MELRLPAQHAQAAAERRSPVMETPAGGGAAAVCLMRRPWPRQKAEDGGDRSKITSASSSSAPAGRASAATPRAQPLYDQFSIGWNELFDAPPNDGKSKPPRTPRNHANLGNLQLQGVVPTGSSAAPPQAVTASPSHASASGAASRGIGGVEAGSDNAFWTSEILTSKKPPFYLRIRGGEQNAIDRSLKEHLLRCKASQLRKPSQIMEAELNQIRTTLNAERREKRVTSRRARQLGRRARVKLSFEDLDELENEYLQSDLLRPLADPIKQAEARLPTELAKDFFAGFSRSRPKEAA
eukprot:TRINITY_DN28840_c1_g1_i1.p1 TRINITY_DN28840_c1_g1~~TRINITY_DN28840_c1_g1_i1.p1  ORF type:complete len:296 (+),score=52.98 TRINITY_DN28840_c1_g1_i1:164-1051(+)